MGGYKLYKILTIVGNFRERFNTFDFPENTVEP